MVNIFGNSPNFQDFQKRWKNAVASDCAAQEAKYKEDVEQIISEIFPKNASELSCEELKNLIEDLKNQKVETYLKYAEAVGLTQSAAV